MKTILNLSVMFLLVSNPVLAMGEKHNEQLAKLEKRCEVLSKETGKQYVMVTGQQVKYQFYPAPPCGFPPLDNKEKMKNYSCPKHKFSYIFSLKENEIIKQIYLTSNTLIDFQKQGLLLNGKQYAVCVLEKSKGNTHLGDIQTLQSISK